MSSICSDESCDEDIKHPIGAATTVIGAMKKELLERRELKKETKRQVFNAMVVPTLLLRMRNVNSAKEAFSRLHACEMVCL